MKLKLSQIQIHGGTQPRVSINEAVVAEYAEIYGSGGELPPPVVVFDGAQYWLADGFHRVHGALHARMTEIEVDGRKGTLRDAILFSVGANATHGLRRSNEDKRKAVRTLLDDEEWSKWSDREIARRCSVGADLVGKIRAETKPHLSETTDSPEPETRIVQRGSTQYEQRIPRKEPEIPREAEKNPAAVAVDMAISREELLDELQAEVESLTKQIAVLQADDQKAQTLRWMRIAEAAQRRQTEIQEVVNAREAELQKQHRILQRICKAVGTADTSKVAALVEALARSNLRTPA